MNREAILLKAAADAAKQEKAVASERERGLRDELSVLKARLAAALDKSTTPVLQPQAQHPMDIVHRHVTVLNEVQTPTITNNVPVPSVTNNVPVPEVKNEFRGGDVSVPAPDMAPIAEALDRMSDSVERVHGKTLVLLKALSDMPVPMVDVAAPNVTVSKPDPVVVNVDMTPVAEALDAMRGVIAELGKLTARMVKATAESLDALREAMMRPIKFERDMYGNIVDGHREES
jgi:hypothetical protein